MPNQGYTMKSTLNSAISLAKYSENYDVTILNVFGEWTKFEDIQKCKIEKPYIQYLTFSQNMVFYRFFTY